MRVRVTPYIVYYESEKHNISMRKLREFTICSKLWVFEIFEGGEKVNWRVGLNSNERRINVEIEAKLKIQKIQIIHILKGN